MNEFMRALRFFVCVYWNLLKEKDENYEKSIEHKSVYIYCLFFKFESEMGNYFIFL